MSNSKSEFLGTAFRSALLAGNHIIKSIGKISNEDIDTKQASDFVTRIDRESEELIITTIKRNFPDHGFLAEESLRETDIRGYRWIIDPLDGTTNFIHGYPVFSVSIALELNSELILGVIYDPLREEIFTAEKNRGAFLNGKQVHVSSISDPGNSLVSTGFPFRKKEVIDQYLNLFRNLFKKVSDIRRAGSAAIDLAHVACGRCDGFFEIGLSPWDIAAGSIIINEAGGIVSDFSGGIRYLSTGNIIAGNQHIHTEILNEVSRVFSGDIDS